MSVRLEPMAISTFLVLDWNFNRRTLALRLAESHFVFRKPTLGSVVKTDNSFVPFRASFAYELLLQKASTRFDVELHFVFQFIGNRLDFHFTCASRSGLSLFQLAEFVDCNILRSHSFVFTRRDAMR